MSFLTRTPRSMAGTVRDGLLSEIDQLRDKVEHVMDDRVSPAVRAVSSRAEHAAADLLAGTRAQAERVSSAVQDHPGRALGLAALLGFAAALLLFRR